MADGSVAVTQKQLDDRFKSFDQKITEQISKQVAKEIETSGQKQIRWDLASIIGSVIAATVLIFMFMNTKIEAVNTEIKAVNTRIDSLEGSMNTKIEAVNTRIDSLEKNLSEFKVEMRTSNQEMKASIQRILDKLDRLEQNRSN